MCSSDLVASLMDTIESINEATQLYILAANLLGRRPNKIPSRVKKQYESFASLGTLDSLSNAWVQIESYFTPTRQRRVPIHPITIRRRERT